MAMAEITIHGAGAFGLSLAYVAAKRGVKVQVIDPFGPGAGASGGVVGALSPHTPERWNDKKEFQFQSLIRARTFWPEVEALGGVSSGYGPVGRITHLNDARAVELAHEREGQTAELWRGLAEWRVMPDDKFADWAGRSATGMIVHDTLSARMNPAAACAALVAACRALGVQIATDGTPMGVQVWATGWQGLLAMSAELDRPVGNGVKGQALVMGYDAGPNAPQLYVGGLHIIPHTNGTVAIGSTSEREFTDPTSIDAQLDEVEARARAACPALRDAPVIQRWAGVRPRARSRAPMLGPWPGREGHFVMNGGFKIGFGMAPRAAEVLADLILDGTDAIPPDFRVEASL